VVILTFATILPVIEIPFVLIQVSKGCCVYYAHNLYKWFVTNPSGAKMWYNFIRQIWHQQKKKKTCTFCKHGWTCASIWVLQLWGLKQGIKVFHIWAFCFFIKCQKEILLILATLPHMHSIISLMIKSIWFICINKFYINNVQPIYFTILVLQSQHHKNIPTISRGNEQHFCKTPIDLNLYPPID
jgi:hypothetical protein